ncbi:RNA-directed DNA polymerase, eukaryota, reverse transcriptase zinc-binding domain protein [Tanacetum coccineum]
MGVWENTSWVRSIAVFINGEIRLFAAFIFKSRMLIFAVSSSGSGILRNGGSRFSDYCSGFDYKRSTGISIDFSHGSPSCCFGSNLIHGSGFGFWKCNNIYIIDKDLKFGFGFIRFCIEWYLGRLKRPCYNVVSGSMVFYKANMCSKDSRFRALDEFSMTSGLYPNMFKSTVFYGNVPDTVKNEIQLAMPFREGVLPARYLGIPLTAKTLSIADCRVLIEKVKNRILDWRNKLLSLAGKLQLVASNFVWSKNDAAKGIASVAWKEVCRPKDEGGLGLKSLKVINHALMVKHLWNIASKKDSLWVKWLNVYRIKGMWGTKLEMGEVVLSGMTSGTPMGRYSVRFKEVIDVPVPVLDHDRDDMALWFDKQNVEVRFSVKEAWRVLRPDVPKVLRHKHVWFSQCIPRHAFILWMAIKGRLKTQDRISRWFSADNMVCPFCKSCKDSHSHLFFQCGFAQGVWERLKSMNRLEDLSCVWAEIISGISIRKANNTLWSIIQRLVLGAAVYFIWRERNFRLFRNLERSNDVVFDNIVDTVRLKLLGLNIKRSVESDKAAAIWRLPIKDVGKEWNFVWSKNDAAKGIANVAWKESVRFKEVIDVPVPVLDHDRDDMALWFDKQNVEVQFSVKEAWRVLRPDVPKVLWHKHVWFSQCIPKHAFILWMAIKGRLKTQDRISRWFSADNMVCPFCKSCQSSSQSPFSSIVFCSSVWERLKSMSRIEDFLVFGLRLSLASCYLEVTISEDVGKEWSVCYGEWVGSVVDLFGFIANVSMQFDSLKGVWVNTSRVRIIATFINGVIRLCCCTLFISSGGLAAAGGSIFSGLLVIKGYSVFMF